MDNQPVAQDENTQNTPQTEQASLNEAQTTQNPFSRPETPKKRKKLLVIIVAILIVAVAAAAYLLIAKKDTTTSNTSQNTQDTQTNATNQQQNFVLASDEMANAKIPEGSAVNVNGKVYVTFQGKTGYLYDLDEYDQIIATGEKDGSPVIYVKKAKYKDDGTLESPMEVIEVAVSTTNTIFTLPDDATSYNLSLSSDLKTLLYEKAISPGSSQMKSINIYEIESKQTTVVFENDEKSSFSPRFIDWVGDTIFFTEGCRECDGGSIPAIFTLNIKTKELVQVVGKESFKLEEDLLSPEFIVDGKGEKVAVLFTDFGLVFEADPAADVLPTAMYVVDVETKKAARVYNNDSYFTEIAGFSEDNSKVYIATMDWEIVDKSDSTTQSFINKKYYKESEPKVLEYNVTTGKITEIDTAKLFNDKVASIFTSEMINDQIVFISGSYGDFQEGSANATVTNQALLLGAIDEEKFISLEEVVSLKTGDPTDLGISSIIISSN